MTPLRLVIILTHPVQYFSPWFRYIAGHRPEIDLTVLYATRPGAEQQGVGFGRPVEWDTDLLSGYRSVVLRPPRPGDDLSSDSLWGMNVGMSAAIRQAAPDVVLIPGWHSVTYLRALAACRWLGIPVLYRGDSNLATRPGGMAGVLWSWRTRLLLRLFDGYLSVGRRASEYLAAFRCLEPLTARSPHAVDNDYFAQAAAPWQQPDARASARAEWGLDSETFVVAYVGKLAPLKRPLDLVHAVAVVGKRLGLLIVGSGPSEEAVEQEAQRQSVRLVRPGFLNQSELGRAYAVADCLVLPSGLRHETWGLVVNEAMATGLPCIVTTAVGCGPDLIVEGETGSIVPATDVKALADAIERIRSARAAGHDFGAACRARVSSYSYASATDGLVTAAGRVLAYRCGPTRPDGRTPRIIACCGGMVIVSGIERMSFEVLRVLGERGAAVHCIVNTWESSRIVALAERIGATWSTGYYWSWLTRRPTVKKAWKIGWDIARTSAGLLADAYRFRPSHVFLPDFTAVVRNAPALAWLRAGGVRTVLRLGNAPEPGRFYRGLWRWLIDPVIDEYVSNSEFIQRELLAHGIHPRKARVIHNTAPARAGGGVPVGPRQPGRVVYVGQVIPPKGLDLLLEAVAALRARGLEATLDVVGDVDGWEAPAYAGFKAGIRARAQQPDLRPHVRFLGYREDVPALMAAAAVHCMPSRPEQKEGFAVVVLEAKQAGTPSVVMPTGSLPEMIAHGMDGWICRDVSVEALTDGLAFLLSDQARLAAASEAARQSGATFGPARFADAWADVFGVACEAGRVAV